MLIFILLKDAMPATEQISISFAADAQKNSVGLKAQLSKRRSITFCDHTISAGHRREYRENIPQFRWPSYFIRRLLVAAGSCPGVDSSLI